MRGEQTYPGDLGGRFFRVGREVAPARGWGSIVVVEDVADGPQAFKIPRRLWVGLEILAEADDEVVHRPGGGGAGISPAHLQELAPAQGSAPIGDEELEEAHLLLREFDLAAPSVGGEGVEMDHVLAEAVGRSQLGDAFASPVRPAFPCRFMIPRRPGQEPLHPQEELVEVKRFGKVIVNAVGQPLHAVFRFALRGEDENRQLFVFDANMAQDGQPIDAGEHDVQDDKLGPPVPPLPERRHAVGGDHHLVSLEGQIQPNTFRYMQIVLHDENPFPGSFFHDAVSMPRIAGGIFRVKVEPLPSPGLSAVTRA